MKGTEEDTIGVENLDDGATKEDVIDGGISIKSQ